MRSSTEVAPRALQGAIVALILGTACATTAEPPPHVIYVKPSTGECGLLITRWDLEQKPLDGAFHALQLPTRSAECRDLLDKVLAHPPELLTPSHDLFGEAAQKPPCERLTLILPSSIENTCKVLGYKYVGEIPTKTLRRCYPDWGPYFGEKCEPWIWIHLATLVVVLLLLASLIYTIGTMRRRRQQALAADSNSPQGE